MAQPTCPTDAVLLRYLEGNFEKGDVIEDHLSLCRSCAHRVVVLAMERPQSSESNTVSLPTRAVERLTRDDDPPGVRDEPTAREADVRGSAGLALSVSILALMSWALPSPLLIFGGPEDAISLQPPAPARSLAPQPEPVRREDLSDVVRLARELRALEAQEASAPLTYHERMKLWRAFAERASGTPYEDYAQVEVDSLLQAQAIASREDYRDLMLISSWVENGKDLDLFFTKLARFRERFPDLYVDALSEAESRARRVQRELDTLASRIRIKVQGREVQVSGEAAVELESLPLEDNLFRFSAAGKSRLLVRFPAPAKSTRIHIFATMVLASIGAAEEGVLSLHLNGEPVVTHWSPGNNTWTQYSWESHALREVDNELLITLQPEAFNQVWISDLDLRIIGATADSQGSR